MPVRIHRIPVQKIRCFGDVDPGEWDELAASLGGGFFHCHAHAVYESTRSNAKPCFVKAFAEDGQCAGVAVGAISSPRFWPFSRFCRIATFAALPATTERTAELEGLILRGLEKELKRKGVFFIELGSADSPNSDRVLRGLSYETKDRAEFYLDLNRPLQDIWESLACECRNIIRKARKLGVVTKREHSPRGLALLHAFQQESLRRHGVYFQMSGGAAQAASLSLLDSGRANLLVSSCGETAINAAMFGVFVGRAYYLLSGSSSDGRKKAGPPHLLWTAIERLKEAGATVLNLGGAAVPAGEDDPAWGLYRFKRDFGASIISQPSGTKTISPLGGALSRVLLTMRAALTSAPTLLVPRTIKPLVTGAASALFRVHIPRAGNPRAADAVSSVGKPHRRSSD